jgi:hypothetical protein
MWISQVHLKKLFRTLDICSAVPEVLFITFIVAVFFALTKNIRDLMGNQCFNFNISPGIS